MNKVFPEVCVCCGKLLFCGGYLNPVITDRLSRGIDEPGGNGTEVGFEVFKLLGNGGGILGHYFQVVYKGVKGAGEGAVFLSCQILDLGNNVFKGFKIRCHFGNGIGYHCFKAVIAEGIGGRSGDHHNAAVAVVETVNGVVDSSQQIGKFSEGNFKTDGVLTFGKVEKEGGSVGSAKIGYLPAVLIVKVDVLCFFAGNYTVDINRAVTESAVTVGLFETGGYIVKAGFLNVEFPFDPLICRTELIALYLVELNYIEGRRICNGGRYGPTRGKWLRMI